MIDISTLLINPISQMRGRYIHAHKGRGRRRGHPKPFEPSSKTRRRQEAMFQQAQQELDLRRQLDEWFSQNMGHISPAFGVMLQNP